MEQSESIRPSCSTHTQAQHVTHLQAGRLLDNPPHPILKHYTHYTHEDSAGTQTLPLLIVFVQTHRC